MTKEEAIQLKKGDVVFVKAVFDCIATNGDAYVRFFWTNCRRARILGNVAVTIDSVLLHSDLQQPAEKPKYDPCRKFQSGDVVEPCKCQGREAWGMNQEETTVLIPSGRYTVLHESCSQVEIQAANGDIFFISPCFLKLITPVEELEPYYVSTNRDCSTCTIFKRTDGTEKAILAYYFTHGKGCANALLSESEAIARAEAERDRLNAEHRKDQNNG